MSDFSTLEESITAFLRIKPMTKASEIARKIGVTRKEVNSFLYKNNGSKYISKGTDPPLWSIMGTQSTVQQVNNVKTVKQKNTKDIIRSSGIEKKRNAEKVFISDQLLENLSVEFSYEGVEISVEILERGLSDPYVTFELESSKELNIIINANSIAETSINSPDALYLHILHCVADAVSLKKIQDAADVLERDEIFNIKSQVFFALSSSKNI